MIIRHSATPSGATAIPIDTAAPALAVHGVFGRLSAKKAAVCAGAFFIALGSTAESAGEITTGLLQQDGQTSLFYVTSILAALTMFGLNIECAYDGISKVANHRFANPLSRKAYGVLAACIAYLLFSEFIKGEYFTNALRDDYPPINENTSANQWIPVALLVGLLNAASFFFIESISMREMVAEKSDETKQHSLGARGLGLVIGVGGGIVEAISTFAVLTDFWQVSSLGLKIILGASSSLNALANYTFRGRWVRGNIDEFYHHLKSPTFHLQSREVIPFALAAGISIYVVNAVRSLNRLLEVKTLEDIGISTTDNPWIQIPARDVLPCVEMIQDGILYTGMYYGP